MDDEGIIQLVFFHGHYAAYHPRFMQMLTGEAVEWTPGVECSRCSRKKGKEAEGTLTTK